MYAFLKDQCESQVIESKINYDPTSPQLGILCPFNEDPSILPDNKGQVIMIAGHKEELLCNAGLLESFNEEFEKMIKYGSLAELFETEFRMWDCPIHYVSLQHVLN